MVRQFWLEDRKGNILNLTDKNNCVFLNEPSGLGYSVTYTTVRFNNTERMESSQLELEPVSGSILFYKETLEKKYNSYFEFTKFTTLSDLILHYKPPNSELGYHCDVRVEKLEKGEVSTEGILVCPVSFKRFSLWTSDKENCIETKKVLLDGKHYPLTRPYKYGILYTTNLKIVNDGAVDSPLRLEITGECSDLQYHLYDESGKKYGAGKIKGTYDFLLIEASDDNEQIVLKKNGEEIPDAYNYQDLSIGVTNEVAVTFLKARPGISTLNIILDKEFSGMVKISWRDLYASV